jgi:hypothetical protein
VNRSDRLIWIHESPDPDARRWREASFDHAEANIRREEAIRTNHSSPDLIDKQRAAAIANWQDPAYREKQRRGLARRYGR